MSKTEKPRQRLVLNTTGEAIQNIKEIRAMLDGLERSYIMNEDNTHWPEIVRPMMSARMLLGNALGFIQSYDWYGFPQSSAYEHTRDLWKDDLIDFKGMDEVEILKGYDKKVRMLLKKLKSVEKVLFRVNYKSEIYDLLQAARLDLVRCRNWLLTTIHYHATDSPS